MLLSYNKSALYLVALLIDTFDAVTVFNYCYDFDISYSFFSIYAFDIFDAVSDSFDVYYISV